MGAALSASCKEVYPGVVTMEQMPCNVDVGSGQGYAVRAGTTPSTAAFGGLLWFIQTSRACLGFFFFIIFLISLNSSSLRPAGVEMNFYPPVSSGFSLPAFSKKNPEGGGSELFAKLQ